MSKEITAQHGGLEGISMTNKQLTEEYSMNHDQEEAYRPETELAGFIYDQAMAMHAEAVVACDAEESSDLLESFRRGVKEGIAVTMMIQEDCEIEAEEKAARAANN